MKVGRQLLQKYAMHFGTFMGVYWILKFILFPVGLTVPFLFFLYVGLTIGIPFMGYYYAKMYRNKICGGFIEFGHAWMFLMAMFMFAAILTSAAHFIYFRFIDNGHIVSVYQGMINTMSAIEVSGTAVDVSQLQEAIELFSALTPIDITLQMLSLNIIIGGFLSLIIALFVQKTPKTFVKS